MRRSSNLLKNNNLEVALIILLAFIVRLLSLNQSLWLDEGITAHVVQQYSLLEIIPKFSVGDFHPPLFYFFEKIWTSIFGYSEVSLRMPSVLFSLITGYVVYLIGKKLKDFDTGIWAMVFFLFNPLVIYYSQEARMYLMAVCLLTAALYFLVTSHKKPAVREIVLFNVFTFLSFLTFYGSVFFIVAMYGVLLFKKEHRKLLLFLPGLIGAILIDAPLLMLQLHNSKAALNQVTNWSSVLGNVTVKNLLLFPVKFSIGRISFDPKKLYYFVSFLWTTIVFLYAWKGFVKNKTLLVLFTVPLILGLLFSFFSPLLQYFRFIYLIVPLSLALAIGIKNEKHKAVIIAVFFIFSGMYLSMPQFHREDWKTVASKISAKKVYAIPSSMDPLKYYKKNIVISDIRKLDLKENRIVVIPYTMDIYGIDYRSILAQSGYIITDSDEYRGVTSEIWMRL